VRHLVALNVVGVEGDQGIEAQVAGLRSAVERDGGVTVSCDELRILCPDYLTVSEQFMRIAAIAQEERWSFAFLDDGTVRFGSYVSFGK
jgi:hypothetical protein